MARSLLRPLDVPDAGKQTALTEHNANKEKVSCFRPSLAESSSLSPWAPSAPLLLPHPRCRPPPRTTSPSPSSTRTRPPPTARRHRIIARWPPPRGRARSTPTRPTARRIRPSPRWRSIVRPSLLPQTSWPPRTRRPPTSTRFVARSCRASEDGQAARLGTGRPQRLLNQGLAVQEL